MDMIPVDSEAVRPCITPETSRKAVSIGMIRWAAMNENVRATRVLINPKTYDILRRSNTDLAIAAWLDIRTGKLRQSIGGCRILLTKRVPCTRIEFE